MPGGREQINLFSTIWNPGKLWRCMRAGGRRWGCMVKKKKKSTTNETLSQFVHCRKIKQLASWINVLWWDYDFDFVVVVVRSGEGACFQPYSMLRLQYWSIICTFLVGRRVAELGMYVLICRVSTVISGNVVHLFRKWDCYPPLCMFFFPLSIILLPLILLLPSTVLLLLVLLLFHLVLSRHPPLPPS